LSAGQAPIIRYHAARDGFEILPADTMPLGIAEPLDLAPGVPMTMRPGDIVAVISDGLLEAVDRRMDELGW